MVGLGQAEAADPFAGGQAGQVLLTLRLAAVGVDRMHHQAALHAHGAAVAAVHAFHLARHQSVAHMVQAGTAVAVDRAAEQAQCAHLAHDLAVEGLVARGHQHAGLELFLAVGPGGVAHGALVVAQLVVQAEGVFPVEFQGAGHGVVSFSIMPPV
jgi:hypothetical protein